MKPWEKTVKEVDVIIEPCRSCRWDHHNKHGYVIKDKATGVSLFHLDLTPGALSIGPIPQQIKKEATLC